jgi:hypothetical protein
MKRQIPLLAAAVLCFSFTARADELTLKDGSKIVGTIVGFEDNAFKVKTSYGFALVQKDEVISIVMSGAPKADAATAVKPPEPPKPAVAPKTEPASKPAPAAARAPSPAADTKSAASDPPAKPPKTESASSTTSSATAPATTASKTPSSSSPAPTSKSAAPPPAPANKPAAGPSATTTASAATPAASPSSAPKNPPPAAAPAASANVAPPPAAPAAPPKASAPEPVREAVSGTTYTNDTYNFRMYKPPGWQMIEGARTILPGAITAMGPSDESTYLLIGLAPAGQSLSNDIDNSEQRLREAMSNFRIIEQKQLTVSGVSSITHRFRGSVDGHEWSGMVVFVPLGPHIYTIFGMTRAQSDLVQIQEQVIQRTIASLQFGR